MNMAAPLPRDGPQVLVQGDPRLIDKITPKFALNHGILPMRRSGAMTLIAAQSRKSFRKARPELEAAFGPVAAVYAPRGDICAAIARSHALELAQKADRYTPGDQSYRTTSLSRIVVITSLVLGLIAFLAVWAPGALAGGLVGWVVLTLVSITGLRTAGALVQIGWARRLARDWRSRRALSVPKDQLPGISLLVPLFRESDIFDSLVRRLERIDYPRDRLEALLILEQSDDQTRAALKDTPLPPWISVISVPPGDIQTKPRALNYALDFAAGEIVGIYDAEDAPAADQLLLVAEAFAKAPRHVACLQGILDFYNARETWLTRCFTIDYAAWFRLILPGLVQLGFTIPLGGTTVFLRRKVLEDIGRWDAHNVTEDADLGIRLARYGYRTRFIPSVTMEEATSEVKPWVRQRSRWIKGYAMTWAVHMRRPVQLFTDLGARRFWGFQTLFLGALSQFLLAPLLWSFWLLMFGLPHPITGLVSPVVLYGLAALFFATEIVTIAVLALSVATPRHRRLIWWVPVMHIYFPLSAIAALKAFAELVTRPFFWDKTAHGHSIVAVPGATPVPPPNPA